MESVGISGRGAGDEWTHQPAAAFPPESAKILDFTERPKLWLADDHDP